jgi:hypothetical protein
MRLLLQLEEWKKQLHDNQGVEGQTYKMTRTEPFKETQYEKIPSKAYNFETLLSELNARSIVEMVNKAFRAYGYKTDMLPVPALFKWYVGYLAGDSTLEVRITTSAFNKIQSAQSEKAQELFKLVGEKALILNFLIQNNDMHEKNFIKNAGTKKHYAIDFGMAFTKSGRGDVDVRIQDLQNSRERLLNHHSDKLERYANYINFWDLFLEHNYEHMLEVFDRNMAIVKKAIMSAKAPEQIKKDTLNGAEDYANRIKIDFRSNLSTLRHFIASTVSFLSKMKAK